MLKTTQAAAASATIFLVIATVLFFLPDAFKVGLWAVGAIVLLTGFMFLIMKISDPEEFVPFMGIGFLMAANMPASFFVGAESMTMHDMMLFMAINFTLCGVLFVLSTVHVAFAMVHGYNMDNSSARRKFG